MTPGTLEDTARRIARAHWLELRCFEILGGWVPSTPEPEVKVALARQSHHHAWHAELFERVLPVANGLDDGGSSHGSSHSDGGVPSVGWVGLLEALVALDQTADRLVAAYGVVLPAKVAEYEAWLAAVDPVRDAPLRRWLGFVVADEQADLAEGRALLDGLPTPAGAASRAAVTAGLEAAGPLLS